MKVRQKITLCVQLGAWFFLFLHGFFAHSHESKPHSGLFQLAEKSQGVNPFSTDLGNGHLAFFTPANDISDSFSLAFSFQAVLGIKNQFQLFLSPTLFLQFARKGILFQSSFYQSLLFSRPPPKLI